MQNNKYSRDILALTLFFGKSLTILLHLFPLAILGVIMFLAGAELAGSAYSDENNKGDFYITVVTAGTALWNAGAALLIGVLLERILRKKQLRIKNPVSM